MFVPLQRAAAPWSFNNWWGQFTEAAGLPNMAGAEYWPSDVQAGDLAWAVDTGSLYVCEDPTPGAAVWAPLSTGAVAALGDTLGWGGDAVGATTTTRYLAPGWEAGTARTFPQSYSVSRAGLLNAMRVVHNNPSGNGLDIVYTLRVNGAPTALSVTLASTAAVGQNLLNAVPVVAGDLVDIEVTKAADILSGSQQPGVSVGFL